MRKHARGSRARACPTLPTLTMYRRSGSSLWRDGGSEMQPDGERSKTAGWCVCPRKQDASAKNWNCGSASNRSKMYSQERGLAGEAWTVQKEAKTSNEGG